VQNHVGVIAHEMMLCATRRALVDAAKSSELMKRGYLLHTGDRQTHTLSVYFFTKKARWLDVLTIRLEENANSGTRAVVTSASTGFLPVSIPLAFLFNILFFFVPFSDGGANVSHIEGLFNHACQSCASLRDVRAVLYATVCGVSLTACHCLLDSQTNLSVDGARHRNAIHGPPRLAVIHAIAACDPFLLVSHSAPSAGICSACHARSFPCVAMLVISYIASFCLSSVKGRQVVGQRVFLVHEKENHTPVGKDVYITHMHMHAARTSISTIATG
jgi:hypothetical protein